MNSTGSHYPALLFCRDLERKGILMTTMDRSVACFSNRFLNELLASLAYQFETTSQFAMDARKVDLTQREAHHLVALLHLQAKDPG